MAIIEGIVINLRGAFGKCNTSGIALHSKGHMAQIEHTVREVAGRVVEPRRSAKGVDAYARQSVATADRRQIGALIVFVYCFISIIYVLNGRKVTRRILSRLVKMKI